MINSLLPFLQIKILKIIIDILCNIAYTICIKYKGGKTMASKVKSNNHVFVLNPRKADAFLKQDNKNFVQLMKKFNKYTKSTSHSKLAK